MDLNFAILYMIIGVKVKSNCGELMTDSESVAGWEAIREVVHRLELFLLKCLSVVKMVEMY